MEDYLLLAPYVGSDIYAPFFLHIWDSVNALTCSTST